MTQLAENSTFQKTVLDNGVRIVTETIPYVRSLAIGFWYITGGRDEPDDLAGIAHYIEHMNFKGTRRRSAATIAREIESRGGHLNAFTSKEITCYYARVVDEQLLRAVDVITDIVLNSLYEEKNVNRERRVILEELKNLEDTPDEMVFDYFIRQLFRDHPMGRSVLGDRKSLERINQDHLIRYRDQNYCGSNLVISASGNLDHLRLVRMIERRFKEFSNYQPDRKPPVSPDLQDNTQDKHTDTQQAHIVLGCRGLSYKDSRKYTLLALNTILGGGMSSRLFQRIRERHGLAYAVYSFLEAYQDTGIFGIYAGTEPQNAQKTLRLIRRELRELFRKPVSNRELKRIKDQLKGNLMLGLESPNVRMNRLARLEIYIGEWVPIDDVIKRIDAVTKGDILEVAEYLFDNQPLFTTILWPN